MLTEPTTVSVVDLGSRNGTFVNFKRVNAIEFAEGDDVHFGPNAVFRFTCSLVREAADADCRGPPADLAGLTRREREVARHVARGSTNAEVAAQLGLQRRTVATHLEHIYAKLAIRWRAELVRLVVEAEL